MSDTPELPQLFTDVKRFNLPYPIVVLSHMPDAARAPRQIRALLGKYTHRGDFKLSSGQYSNHFIDVKSALLAHPIEFSTKLRRAIRALSNGVAGSRCALVGHGQGGALLLGLLAGDTHMGHLVISDPKPDLPAMCPPIPAGSSVILLDDVLTSGRTLRGMHDTVKTAGGVVVGGIVVALHDDPALY